MVIKSKISGCEKSRNAEWYNEYKIRLILKILSLFLAHMLTYFCETLSNVIKKTRMLAEIEM